MIVCANCYHKRTFHKKVDGNAWCSVNFCACKEFIERRTPANRRKLHEDFDQFLDEYADSQDDSENLTEKL